MTKHLGTLNTFLIVAFWVAMNSLLVWNDIESRRQRAFKRGVDSFLGDLSTRESWLSIHQDHRKVGYSGYTMEKLHTTKGIEYQIAVETLYRGKWPLPDFLTRLLANSNQLWIQGRLFLDEALLPTTLRMDIVLTSLRGTSIEQVRNVSLTGERRSERFVVGVRLGNGDDGNDEAARPDFQIALPVEKMMLSNGISPTLPVADYEPGKRYRVSVFDPLSSLGFDSDSATVEVIEKRVREVDALLVDVFEVETRFRGQTSRAWVTARGETLRQEIREPFNLLLLKEKDRPGARREFEPRGPDPTGTDESAKQESDG